MRSKLVPALGALLMFAGTAHALISGQRTGFMWQGLEGITVSVTNKAGDVVMRAQTDAKGEIRTSSLPPGEYQMEVDGPSVIAAMDKVAPPAKKSSGPSVSIGGLFGSGSSRSSSGHEGNGHEQSRSHSSSGGVGMSLNMSGGDNGSSPGRLEFEVGYDSHDRLSAGDSNRPAHPPSIKDEMVRESATGGTSEGNDSKYSIDIPYCRDTAGQGMRVGITIPAPSLGTLRIAALGVFHDEK